MSAAIDSAAAQGRATEQLELAETVEALRAELARQLPGRGQSSSSQWPECSWSSTLL